MTRYLLAIVFLCSACADGTIQPSRSPDDPASTSAPEAPPWPPAPSGTPSAGASPAAAPAHHHHAPMNEAGAADAGAEAGR